MQPNPTMKYLLNCEGIGAIIEMPKDKPSAYWGEVQDSFIRACGYDPTVTWLDMIQLYPDQVIDGVSYDWGLAGPDGASFRLHKLPSVSDEQLDRAKAKLRRDQDVVRMSVLRVKQLIPFTLP